jgi:SdiA-regulated
MNRIPQLLLCFILLSASSCDSQKVYKNPDGYNLNKPEKFKMPDVLHEISGIAFNKGNSDTIYAEQDEEGKLFHFKLGDKKMIISKFGKHGDFEDVTICNNYVIMLRSDGVLFTFALSEANKEKADNVKEWDDILPAGEYEGLSSNNTNGEVYVLCKHCSDDKTSKRTSGFIFKLGNDGSIKSSGNFEINIKDIDVKTGGDKISFHPSALAQNPFTKEWYILSSVNKLLVVADSNWKIKDTYPLNPSLFPQPEGITFDDKRTLYISNERNTAAYGTILKFTYNKN